MRRYPPRQPTAGIYERPAAALAQQEPALRAEADALVHPALYGAGSTLPHSSIYETARHVQQLQPRLFPPGGHDLPGRLRPLSRPLANASRFQQALMLQHRMEAVDLDQELGGGVNNGGSTPYSSGDDAFAL